MSEPNDFTLAEIQEMRSAWYAAGLEQFDRIARVAREMGDPVEVICRRYTVFSSGSVTIQLNESSGPWDPKNSRFHRVRRMFISVGKLIPVSNPRQGLLKIRETRVAIIDASTIDPSTAGFQPDDLYFRPGKWVDSVLRLEPVAVEMERARAIAADNELRDKIFRQLSLSREV